MRSPTRGTGFLLFALVTVLLPLSSGEALAVDATLCPPRGVLPGDCPIWTATSARLGVAAAIAPDDSLLYVLTGAEAQVIAYDPRTGATEWSIPLAVGISAGAEMELSATGEVLYIAAEVDRTGATRSDFLTGAYDATTGAEIWTRREVRASRDVPAAIAVSAAGDRVVTVGSLSGSHGVYAYDATTGDLVWTYERPAAEASDVATSPDGSVVFVTGRVEAGTERDNYLTIAFDAATGSVLWTAEYDDPASHSNAGRKVAVTPDGSTVVVTGMHWGVMGATVAYRAADGVPLWSRTHEFRSSGGPTNTSAANMGFVYALAISPDGSNVYVGGGHFCGEFGSCDMVIAALDSSTGDVRWFRVHDRRGSSFENVDALIASSDGSTLYASGFWGGTGNSSPNWLAGPAVEAVTRGQDVIGIDTVDGSMRWSGYYNGWAADLVLDQDESTLFVVGNGTRDRLGLEETAAFTLKGVLPEVVR